MRENARKPNAANEASKARATANLEKKVALLKLWSIKGVPAGIAAPSNLGQLRNLTWPAKGIEKTGSSHTTDRNDSPQNAKVIAEAEGLMQELAKQQAKPSRQPYKPLEVRLRDKTAELKDEQNLNRSMVSQIAALTHQLFNLKRLPHENQGLADTAERLRKELVEKSRELDIAKGRPGLRREK